MKYLITGGAGFIGSHLADVLLARGDAVTALDDLSTGSEANIRDLVDHPRFVLHEGTILDHGVVAELAARHDVIAHLAAAVGVKLIVERPLDSLITNIRGTEILLDAAAETGAKVLVTSTSEIYGKNANGPVKEDDDRILGSPFKSRWSYSTSKAVDEILANGYFRDRGLPTIVVRLFNTVGPRQTGSYGMVIPRFVRQAVDGEPITVYGDGTQRRSFCHVHDVVRALVELLDHPGAVGDVFNVGARNEVSIIELAGLIRTATGSASPIVRIPYDEAYEAGFEDMERRVPDTSKLEALTGWRPERTLPHVIEDVVAYERARRAGVA